MDEEASEVNGARDPRGYGALSESSSSFSPTAANFPDSGSFRDPSSSEEARQLLVPSEQSMGETPDQILNSYGECFARVTKSEANRAFRPVQSIHPTNISLDGQCLVSDSYANDGLCILAGRRLYRQHDKLHPNAGHNLRGGEFSFHSAITHVV